jgi:hypothetical protein
MAAAGLLVIASASAPIEAATPSPTPNPCLAAGACALITVSLTGNGSGTVASGDGFIHCHREGGITTGPCSHIYDTTGGPVPWSLTEGPDPGSYMCTNNSCAFGTGARGGFFNGSEVVTADHEFKLVNPALVTVTRGGNGSGKVTSTQPGISCGSDCSSEYNEGSSLTLQAVAAGSSTFAGWGKGSCAGQGSTCTFVVGAGPITIRPTFSLKATPAPSVAPTSTPEASPSIAATPEPTTAPASPASTSAGPSQPAPTTPPTVVPAASSGGDSMIPTLLGLLLGVGFGFGLGYAVRGRRRAT